MTAEWAAWRDITDVATRRTGHLVGRACKRGMDIACAVLLTVLLSPLLLVAALAVRLSSPGPVFFRQQRVGRDGRGFVMLKLRTMYCDSGDGIHRDYVRRLMAGEVQADDGLYKLQRDPRVTPVGVWLRRTSIDELPQLWNVIRGDMSLVGPRPALTWELELFPPWAHRRFEVRPGISGLWQVSGRNRLTMPQGLALDVRYVEERSLLLDLLILVRTVGAVLGSGTR
jgi:lipopolysaccharide/colanic/teichoic acid biosynthesis glycosyltransferase